MQISIIKSVIYRNRRDVKRQLFDELNSVTSSSLATIDKYNKIKELIDKLNLTSYLDRFDNSLSYGKENIEVNLYHYLASLCDYITQLFYDYDEELFNEYLKTLESPKSNYLYIMLWLGCVEHKKIKSNIIHLQMITIFDRVYDVLLLGEDVIIFDKFGDIVENLYSVIHIGKYMDLSHALRLKKVREIKTKQLIIK